MTTIKRILYATDLSPISEPAWQEARQFGRLFDAEILLVHVVPLVMLPLEGYFPPQMYDELVQGARREAEAAFDRLLGSVVGSGLKIRIRLEDGAPAERILAVANEEQADVVIVGTHGRAGLQRAILGSVADRLVRQAPCPVLTVQPTLGDKAGREDPADLLCDRLLADRPSGMALGGLDRQRRGRRDRSGSRDLLAGPGSSSLGGDAGPDRSDAARAGSPRGPAVPRAVPVPGRPHQRAPVARGPGRADRPPGPGTVRRPHCHGDSRLVGRCSLDARFRRTSRDPGGDVPRPHGGTSQRVGARRRIARSRAVNPLPHRYTVRLAESGSGDATLAADGLPDRGSAAHPRPRRPASALTREVVRSATD